MNDPKNEGTSLEEVVNAIQEVAKKIYKKKVRMPLWLDKIKKNREKKN